MKPSYWTPQTVLTGSILTKILSGKVVHLFMKKENHMPRSQSQETCRITSEVEVIEEISLPKGVGEEVVRVWDP